MWLLLACTPPSDPLPADSPADSPDSTLDSAPPASICEAWPAPTGPVHEVDPSMSQDAIEAVIADAAPGDTVRFSAGEYAIDDLWVRSPGITLRGEGVLDGSGGQASVLVIAASDVVVTGLRIQNSWWHPIHVRPDGADLSGVVLHDLDVVDPGQQAIKINTDGDGHVVDDGVISCSRIELTDAGRPNVRDNCYTGGVDAHQARGWVVRDNDIRGFWCEAGLSEHGVHFWQGSRDTQILRNVLVNNARGIGLGLYDDEPDGRTYEDAPCADGAGHYGGVIANNLMWVTDEDVFASGSGMDGGIALASACGVEVVHNTVFSSSEPFASIEYRFERSDPVLLNNLVTHSIKPREATASRDEANLTATEADFDDALGHLAEGSAAIDAGVSTSIATDRDGDQRGAPDVGCDER